MVRAAYGPSPANSGGQRSTEPRRTSPRGGAFLFQGVRPSTKSAKCSIATGKVPDQRAPGSETTRGYVDGLLSDFFYEKEEALKAEIEQDIERENQRPSSGVP